MQLVEGDIAAQTKRVMENLRAVLAAAGCSFADVVRTTIYLVDLAHFATVNETYGRFFEAPYPARATVQVAALPKGAQVEIDAIAVRPYGSALPGHRPVADADGLAEATVERARDGARRARADDAVVDADDRQELADARRDEDLVGGVDLVERHRSLVDGDAQGGAPPRGRAPA